MSTSKRGIVFSIDALLAAILLSLFAAGMVFLSASSSGEDPGQLLAKKQASDMLLSMDKAGLFTGLPAVEKPRINMTLQSMLPQDTGYMLQVDYYNYSEDGSGFLRVDGYTWGNASNAEKVGLGQRNFVVARQGQMPLYGIAKLSVWKGS